MKFYNREKELKALDEIRQMSFNNHSQMTVLTGRRRVAEVKRQGKNYKPELFEEKVNAIRTKLFFKYKIETQCLTMEDM